MKNMNRVKETCKVYTIFIIGIVLQVTQKIKKETERSVKQILFLYTKTLKTYSI